MAFFDSSVLHSFEEPADFLHLYEFKQRKTVALLEDMTPTDFERTFRCDMYCFDALHKDYGPYLVRPGSNNGQDVTVFEKQLLFNAWSGEGVSMGFLGQMFGISKKAVCNAIHDVMTVYHEHLSDHLHFPTSRTDCKRIADGFRKNWSPNWPEEIDVATVLDGSHMPVKLWSSDYKAYLNRKGFSSLNTLVGVDDELFFTHCLSAWPGLKC